MTLFSKTASTSSALENVLLAWAELRSPGRIVAMAATRFATALAGLICVPLAVLSGNTAYTMSALAILSAALPSIVSLVFLNRRNPDRAMQAGGLTLALIAILAALSGGATVGLALLAVAALIETAIYGAGRQWLAFSTLLFSALIGAASPLLPGQGGIAAGHIEPAVVISVLAAVLYGAVGLVFTVRRMINNEQHAETTIARMRDMIMALGDVAVDTDRSGRALGISDNVSPALGVHHDDLLGRGLVERTHIADRPLLLKTIGDTVADRIPARIKLRLRLEQPASGGASYSWVEIRTLPAPESNRAVLVLRDVSQSEDELHRLRTEEATRQAATRNRGLFISSLSHEVRTPLNAVIGFSEMLSNPDMGPMPPETVREYAKIMNDSGQQLLRLVSATIDLIRLDTNTYEVNPEDLGLAGLIDTCVEEVSEQAEARKITILRQVPPFLPDVTTDRRALQQAIAQILSNAVKFAPADGRVICEARAIGNRVVFAISDEGPGIASDHLSSICDPFFQGDNSYDRAASGAGLGLALVKRLVEVLGGELRIVSRIGAGTRVEIDLPLTSAAQIPAAPEPIDATLGNPVAPFHEYQQKKTA